MCTSSLVKVFRIGMLALSLGVGLFSPARAAQSLDTIQLDNGIRLRDWVDLPAVQSVQSPSETGERAVEYIKRYGPYRELLDIVWKATRSKAFEEQAITAENAVQKLSELDRARRKLGEWPQLTISHARAAFLSGKPDMALADLKSWLKVVPVDDRRRKEIVALVVESEKDGAAVTRYAAALQAEADSRVKAEQREQDLRVRRATKRFVLPPEIPRQVEDTLLSNPLFTSLPDSIPVHCDKTEKHYLLHPSRKGADDYASGPAGVIQETYWKEKTFDTAEYNYSALSILGGLMNLKDSRGYFVTSIMNAEGNIFPLATGNKFRVLFKANANPSVEQRLQCEVLEKIDLKSQQPNLDLGETYIVSCEGKERYSVCSSSLGLCLGGLAWPKTAGTKPPDFSGRFPFPMRGSDFGQTISCSRK